MSDVEEALHFAETDSVFQNHYAEGLRIKGLNLYKFGESRKAVESLEHSLSLYTALNDTGSIPTLLMETGMIYNVVGDREFAMKSYQEALKVKAGGKESVLSGRNIE